MATIVRPTKEGGVTTYQAKVALGFKDILASEVDADLDTMYAAWNGGVDSVTLKDASVTEAKLASDAHTWTIAGTTIKPFDATKAVAVPGTPTTGAPAIILGAGTSKMRLQTNNATAAVAVMSANRDWVAATVDDNTKASWQIVANANGDNMTVGRGAPGVTSVTSLLTLDNIGTATLQAVDAQHGVLNVRAGGTVGGGGGIASFKGTGFRGTNASPTPAVIGDFLCQVTALGVSTAGGGASEQGLLRFLATESWSATARGTRLDVWCTNNGSTAAANTHQFAQNGDITIVGNNAQKNTGTTWINPSDPRLKDDVAPYAAGLEKICQLAPITYRLKAQPDSPLCYGFDASAVKDIFPECVSTTRMKLDPADEEETADVLTFDMHPILVALVNAVKELAAKRNGAG